MPSSSSDGAETVHFGQRALIDVVELGRAVGLVSVGCVPWLASFQAWNGVTHG